MNKPVFGFAFAAAILCAQSTASIAGLAWMSGQWSGRTGNAASEEHWMAPAGGAMLGVSRVVSGDRMAFFEYMRIETRPDGIYYVAQPGGKPPTSFKLVRSGPALAVFENPAHDHPKVITYRLDGRNSMVAIIEGDENGKHRRQEFRFVRAAGPAGVK